MKVSKDELLIQQALNIEDLKRQVALYKEAEDTIHNIMYCIGGPLNDNKLGYTKEQLSTFLAIKNAIGS